VRLVEDRVRQLHRQLQIKNTELEEVSWFQSFHNNSVFDVYSSSLLDQGDSPQVATGVSINQTRCGGHASGGHLVGLFWLISSLVSLYQLNSNVTYTL
jgi:hypothetical protein